MVISYTCNSFVKLNGKQIKSHNMTMLYADQCFIKVCYEEKENKYHGCERWKEIHPEDHCLTSQGLQSDGKH